MDALPSTASLRKDQPMADPRVEPSDPHRAADAVRPMQTLRTDLLLDLLAAPTSELLFLREFAINGCEAIRDAAKDGGTVLFDVDRHHLAMSAVARLSIVDDGIGMRPDELVRYIGNLSASGKDHRVGANHGVGCKIAGARASPRGIEFRSWRDGAGWMVVLCQHPSGAWGLRELRPDAAGDERYLLALQDADRPPLLAGPRPRDGTKATFLGASEGAHTYVAPAVVTEGRAMWVRRYLNDRLYEIPHGATILVREHASTATTRQGPGAAQCDGICERVRGARALLEAHCTSSGTVNLSDARCHWWVLGRPHRRARRPVAREWAATGYFGLLHNAEILESQKGVHGGQQGLSSHFKIRVGAERVVLLLEPRDTAAVKSDIARMTLSIDGQPLPWVRWGHEFAAAMPREISELQRSVLDDEASGKRRRRILSAKWSRVSEPIVAMLHVPAPPKTREPHAARHPRTGVDDEPLSRPRVWTQPATNAHGSAPRTGSPAHPAPRAKDRLRRSADDRSASARATTRGLRYPKTLWLSPGDVPDALHNKAARYDPDDDVLTISSDFPVYVAQLDRLLEEYASDPDSAAIITEKLRQWWELTLVEAIDMAGRLATDQHELALLTSPWSLSAATSALSPIAQHLRREIPLQLGRHTTIQSDTADDEGPLRRPP
jgi:hypothetical protein